MTASATTSSKPIRTEIAALWQLAWPVLVGQVATVGMGVADVSMTGHVSAAQLAAVSLGASVWMIVLVTVMGTMMAINTVVAHELGAARYDRIPHIVRQGLWKGLGVGLVACVLANLATLVFDHIGLDAEVNHSASMFVHISSIGMPAFACYRALYGYTTSINQTKPVMVIALLGLLINIGVNYLLVFGNWGLPQLGAVGCAVATALGMWLMLAAMVAWMAHAAPYRQTYPFTHWEGPHWGEIGSMLRLGLPIGVTYFAEVSAFGAVSLLLAPFGVVPVSANQIALNFSSLTFMVPLSFGIALISRVGQALGEGDPRRARFVAWVGVGLSLAVAVGSALFIATFRWQIARAYTVRPRSAGAVRAPAAAGRRVPALRRHPGCRIERDPRLQGHAPADADPAAGLLGRVAATRLCARHRTALDSIRARRADAGHRLLDWTGARTDRGRLLLAGSLRQLARARIADPASTITSAAPPTGAH